MINYKELILGLLFALAIVLRYYFQKCWLKDKDSYHETVLRKGTVSYYFSIILCAVMSVILIIKSIV